MTQNLDGQVASRFAENDQEAERRFNEYKSKDPFPSVPPALLNSADIADYAATTGMIFPFEERDRLKSASYSIDMLGKCVYWDGRGNKKSFILERGKELRLKPNSIVFITLEPMFRIPDYIALRFNLQIKHVYKGFLVGTGPLVDPGFVGKLSLPLHNLTANEYVLKGGDPIIWMEFTKLSPNNKWQTETDISVRSGVYMGFPGRKNELDIDDYLDQAIGRGGELKSSIPEAVKDAEKAAEAARSDAEKARQKVDDTEHRVNDVLVDMRIENEQLKTTVAKDIEIIKAQTEARITRASVIGTLLVAALSFIGIILPTFNLIKTTTDSFVGTKLELKDLSDNRVKELETQIHSLKQQVAALETRLNQVSASASTSAGTSKDPRRKSP
jgi:deoxycytidine triphosphate deaminase